MQNRGINRNFHWAEIAQVVMNAHGNEHAYFYDHDNLVEENTFRAVHIGTPELAPTVVGDPTVFFNGMIYTTGRKAVATDFFNKNYFYDVDPGSTESHTCVISGDGWEDYTDFQENMMYNLQEYSHFEPPPLINQNCNDGGACRATANVSLHCTHYCLECSICGNTSYAGNIDFDSNNPGGSAAHINDYKEMYLLLASDQLPGPDPLPASAEIMDKLYQVIKKYDPDWIDVEETRDGLPTTYGLSQNYPTPFNPETQIKFQLPKSAFVTIQVFNLPGEKVTTLVNERTEAGYHQTTFDGSKLSRGVYFYRIKAGHYVKTRKCLLMK